MTVVPPIELPEGKSYGELMKGYLTLMRSLGVALDVAAREVLDDLRGPRWFPNLIAKRKLDGAKHARGRYQDPFDPSIVLADYAYELDSPYRQVFSASQASVAGAKKILGIRNRWLHFGQDPSAADMLDCTRTVREFAVMEELDLAGKIVPLGKRLERIITGRYHTAPKSAAAPVPTPATSSARVPAPPAPPVEPPEVPAAAAPEPRPRIGGMWIGPIPTERFTRTRFGDLVDATGASIRDRISGDVDEKVRAWFAAGPFDQQVWIADDGAVGGFVAGDERLLGWLGGEPEREGPRGFYTPHWYEAHDGEFVDLDSGATRATDLAADAPVETVFRVTTYGDLVAFDIDGPELVGTVTPADWFPGHLG